MKKIFKFSLLFFFLLFFSLLLIPRKVILTYFKVNAENIPQKVDLIVVMGGGAIRKGKISPGRASVERIGEAVKILKRGISNRIFFAGYPGEQKLAEGMFLKMGVKKCDILHFSVREKSHTGTEGDVLMVRDLVRIKGFKSILVITSPYHELRCKKIFERVFKKNGLDVKISFYHISGGGEIYKCSFLRYLKLILHEFFGLIYERTLG